MSPTPLLDKQIAKIAPGEAFSEKSFKEILVSMQGILVSMTPYQKGRLVKVIQDSDDSNQLSEADIGKIFDSDQISCEQHEANLRENQETLFSWRNKMLAEAYTTAEVVNLLEVSSRQTPHDRLKRHALFAIEDKHQKLFPAWQFDPHGPNGVVAGFPEVLKLLARVPRWTVMCWFNENNEELGRTPIDALKMGRLEAVKCEAEIVAAAF